MRIRILCVALAFAAPLALGGCLRDPYVSQAIVQQSGSWKIDKQTDRVTGGSVSSAYVRAEASNTNVAFPQPAMLQLMCFINKPVANFQFEFKIGQDRNSFLGYRFDDKPGHETNARFAASAQTVVIEDDAEIAQFVSELMISNSLYIRIRSFNTGRTTAEFKVDGAPRAITAAYATCPVEPPKPPPQQAGPARAKRQA